MIQEGLIQGSVFCPNIFFVYINDIMNCIAMKQLNYSRPVPGLPRDNGDGII